MSAEYVKKTRQGASGFMIRDHNGCPVLAGARNAGQMHDALMTEAPACMKALELANDHAISCIQLETNASQLRERSNLLNGDGQGPEWGMSFSDIRELLHEHFICSNVLGPGSWTCVD